MDRRQLLFGMTALAVGSPSLNDLLTAQSIETANQSPGTNNTRISDREKAGLRGLVKTCVEDQIKTEYDPAGRMISSRWSSNVDGSESIATWTYDGSGRLLRTTSRNRDGSPSEQVYFYDEKGRLLSIIEGSGDRTSFQYDEQGPKTEIRSLAQKPDEPREAVAVGLGAVFADVLAPTAPATPAASRRPTMTTISQRKPKPMTPTGIF